MKKQHRWILPLAAALLITGVAGIALGEPITAAWRVVTRYTPRNLAQEAQTMAECAKCHETDEFHTCETCHDDHGAVEMEGVPFYAVVAFEGDVPDPGYVLLDDILPYRDQPHSYASLLDVLEDQGAGDFTSATLFSQDGGSITLARDQISEKAWLMPFTDGIRFASEDLHVSTWIKGIQRIVVVGRETPLEIDGENTSMGRLLLGTTQSAQVEQTEVMLKSQEDGQVRKAGVASRIEGVPLDNIVAHYPFTQLILRTADGDEHTLTGEEAQGALLAQIYGKNMLVLPERGRSQWIIDVTSIRSEPED